MQDLNLIAVKRSHFLNHSLELWILLRIMLIVEVVHWGSCTAARIPPIGFSLFA